MRRDVTLELVLRHILGIERRAGRLRFRTDERLIILQPVPRSSVDDEVVIRCRRLRQLRFERRILLGDLPPEDLVDLLRGLDEFCRDLALVVVQQRMVVVDDGARELCRAPRYIRGHRHSRGGGRRHWRWCGGLTCRREERGHQSGALHRRRIVLSSRPDNT